MQIKLGISDDALYQIDAWLRDASASEAYVLFNNVPRIHDVRRFRELGLSLERMA